MISANKCFSAVVILLLSAKYTLTSPERCNEALCGSIISKCLLTKECDCQITDCFCCEECFHCLGELYSECCPCLEMCPQIEGKNNSQTKEKSETDRLDGIPDLFAALTVGPANDMWTPFTSRGGGSDHKELIQENSLEEVDNDSEQCTVVYLHTCLTWNKCKKHCESMGASSYRWFYDGCCECAGFGCSEGETVEKKCRNCPEREDDNDLDYGDLSVWDYGEDDND